MLDALRDRVIDLSLEVLDIDNDDCDPAGASASPAKK